MREHLGGGGYIANTVILHTELIVNETTAKRERRMTTELCFVVCTKGKYLFKSG